MSLSPPKSTTPRGVTRSAWGPDPGPPAIEPTSGQQVLALPPMLLPVQLAVDESGVAELAALIGSAVADAVCAGVLAGLARARQQNEEATPPPTAG